MDINIDRVTGKATLSPSVLTYDITVPENFVLTKTIQVQQGTKQKTNENGQLLYKDNVVKNVDGSEAYDEVTAAQKAIKFTEQPQTITSVGEDGEESTQTITVQVPTEFEDLEPVIIPNMIPKTVDITTNPGEFTVLEVLQAKEIAVQKESGRQYACIFEFLTEANIDLTKPKLANTGVRVMELLPHGEITSKTLILEKSTKIIHLDSFEADEGLIPTVNGAGLVNGVFTFDTAVSEVVFKVENPTDKYLNAYAFAITYDEALS